MNLSENNPVTAAVIAIGRANIPTPIAELRVSPVKRSNKQ